MKNTKNVKRTKGNLYNNLADGTTELITNKNEVILIDTEDFDLLKEYNWIINNGRVVTRKMTKGKRVSVYMSRLLLDGEDIEGKVVSYINGNTLDNRKSNLRCGNTYTHLKNDTTEIYTINNEKILIDTEDFEKVRDYTWVLHHGYVVTYRKKDGKRAMLNMSRVLFEGIDITTRRIIYANRDKLDNRRCNLCVKGVTS